VDPYAPPDAEIGPSPLGLEPAGIHREGKVLVVPRGSEHALPARCLKCGEATTVDPLVRKVAWHPRWVFFLLLLNVIFFAIGAALTRKRMELAMPLCDQHQRTRRTLLYGGLLSMIGSWVVGFGLAIALDNDASAVLAIAGGLLGTAGLITTLAVLSPLSAQRIDEQEGRFFGAKPAFLDHVPGA